MFPTQQKDGHINASRLQQVPPGPKRFHQVQNGSTRSQQVAGITRSQKASGCFTQRLLALEQARALLEEGNKSPPNLGTAMQLEMLATTKLAKGTIPDNPFPSLL